MLTRHKAIDRWLMIEGMLGHPWVASTNQYPLSRGPAVARFFTSKHVARTSLRQLLEIHGNTHPAERPEPDEQRDKGSGEDTQAS
jgi:hypothetical protein